MIIEKYADGHVAYPLRLKGLIVAEDDTFDDVIREIRPAIDFHVNTFGQEAIEGYDPVEACFDQTIGSRRYFISEQPPWPKCIYQYIFDNMYLYYNIVSLSSRHHAA